MSKRGDVFGTVVISVADAAFHLQVVAGLRLDELRKLGLGWAGYLPLAGQQEVETRYKDKCKNEPLQRHRSKASLTIGAWPATS